MLSSCSSSLLSGTVITARRDSPALKGRNISMAKMLDRVWMLAMAPLLSTSSHMGMPTTNLTR